MTNGTMEWRTLKRHAERSEASKKHYVKRTMIKRITLLWLLATVSMAATAQSFNPIPRAWKWLDSKEIAYTFDGSFADSTAFAMDAKTHKCRPVSAPAKYTAFPVEPQGAVNLTYSPDSTMLAFTRDNDLYTIDIASGKETRLTFDGSELILNGYASWVYYEEILGRPTRYRAFWWSPDSRTLAFYRFDNSAVPMFPIYSPKGQDGSLRQTRYPKCGEPNPQVRIGFAPIDGSKIVWADFNEKDDQYFGTPFWGADSKALFVSREPRVQNTLDLYRVSALDGVKTPIYHEEYKTWLDWIEGMLFTSKGLYMVRNFETGWQQIYFLSYDGTTFKRLTDGDNWRVSLLAADEKTGEVYFTAERGQHVRNGLYKVDARCRITAISDPALDAARAAISPDFRYSAVLLSNFSTPSQLWILDNAKTSLAGKPYAAGKGDYKVADSKGPDYKATDYALPQLIYMTTKDGFELPASIVYPRGFDPAKKYPVHMDIYGGPDTPMVKDHWTMPYPGNQWWSDHGIIEITADCRAAGHNGRAGTDMIYRQLDEVEVQDFVEWAQYLQALPYVKGDKIGVEGFSFGGTMTALLVMDHPEAFHYGIAGGGVYDWSLYDTHYTERFMDTPQNNPEGYARTRVISHAKNYVTKYAKEAPGIEPVMLKLTHGTGDDNVHFQNTLQLIDELHRGGSKFEFMIYPDGMHGYRGYQGSHFQAANREFWLKYLKNE